MTKIPRHSYANYLFQLVIYMLSFQVFLCDTARPVVMNDIIGPIYPERHTSFASLAPHVSLLAPSPSPRTTFIANITSPTVPHVVKWFMSAFSIRGAYPPACKVRRVVSAPLPRRHDLLMSYISFPIPDCDRQSVAGLRDGATMTSLNAQHDLDDCYGSVSGTSCALCE
jgi:hypothetical protein